MKTINQRVAAVGERAAQVMPARDGYAYVIVAVRIDGGEPIASAGNMSTDGQQLLLRAVLDSFAFGTDTFEANIKVPPGGEAELDATPEELKIPAALRYAQQYARDHGLPEACAVCGRPNYPYRPLQECCAGEHGTRGGGRPPAQPLPRRVCNVCAFRADRGAGRDGNLCPILGCPGELQDA